LDALLGHMCDTASAEQLIAMLELRLIFGPAELRSQICDAVRDLLTSRVVPDALIAHARARIGELDALGSPIATTDFILFERIRRTFDETVRALQLRHAKASSELLTPSITKALAVFAQQRFMDADTVRDALAARHRLRQVEIMRSVRFGGSDQNSRTPFSADSDLLLATGMVDPAELRAFLAEGVALLRAIRDRHLH
jgi:hypothetical protein